MTQASVSTVFISYSHKDSRWLEDLRSMLSPLGETGAIQVWWDGKIQPSDEWRREIEDALSSARVAVLLVSRHFLASDFIKQEELPYLLEAARRRKVKIFWLLVSPCLYENTALWEIQALNDVARPLNSLRKASRERVLKAASQTIAEAVGVQLTVRQDADRSGIRHETSDTSSFPPEIPSVPNLHPQARGPKPIRDEVQDVDAVTLVRARAPEVLQGCGRILGTIFFVYVASVFYSLAFLVIAVPISRLRWYKQTWTVEKVFNAYCGVGFLGFLGFLMCFAHAVLIAMNHGALRGARTYFVDMTILFVGMSILAAITYSNFLEQIPWLLGALGALPISLLTEQWIARWLEQRGGAKPFRA